MLDEYRYSVQSPFISLVPIPPAKRDAIREQAWSIWEFFSTITEFLYHPVLTIFAQERPVVLLKKLVEVFENGENENDPILDGDNGRCLNVLVPLIIERFPELEPLSPETREELAIFLDSVLILLAELDEGALRDFLRDIYPSLTDFCPGVRDYLNYDSDYPVLAQFERYFQHLLKYMCGGSRASKPADPASPRKGVDDAVISQIYADIHLKYGCYTPPGFWEGLRGTPRYSVVIRLLGIPPGVQLFDLPCVFVYPFLIEDRALQVKGCKEVLVQLFKLVLVHEHGHALLRHGILKTGSNAQWCRKSRQRKNDAIRKKYPWIEEGIAMYLEREYIESVIGDRWPDCWQPLIDENTRFVDSDNDLTRWPYHAQHVIEAFVNSSKTFFKTHLKNWKMVPEKFHERLESWLP